MSGIKVQRVIDPSPEEFEAVHHIVYTSFLSSTFVLAMSDNDPAAMERYLRLKLTALLAFGEVWTAAVGDGPIESVAMWFPPGRSLWDSPEMRALGLDEWNASMPSEHIQWMATVFAPISAAAAAATGGVAKANWSLSMLGTLPSGRGRGLGRALLASKAATAQEEGKKLALNTQTAENVAFYESAGFKVVNRSQVELQDGLGTSIFVTMVHDCC